DELGSGCNFEVAGFSLPPPATNTGIPNFPNYDLGPLAGSPCDTLTAINEPGELNEVSIYPNPANQIFNIVYHVKKESLFELIDANGKVRQRATLFPYFKNRLVWVNELESGLYFYRITSNGEVVATGKIAVVR
ncbi:MAG: T9SS type A sorting domain-containing protein, partial [Chitinophagales bacterium]